MARMKCSVAMATFNGREYLPDQVDTVLSQLSAEDELVVADDGSTDGTLAWLADLADRDPRVRLLPGGGHAGVVGNFGRAIAACTGDLVFLCDQDDLWRPDKVRTFVACFEADPALQAATSDAALVDAGGGLLAPSFYAERGCGPGLWKNFYKNTWLGCCMVFRCRLRAVALPMPRSLPMHDMWIGLLGECTGRVRFLPQVLVDYRRHGRNATAGRPSGALTVVRWRLRLLGAMLSRTGRILRARRSLPKPAVAKGGEGA